MAAEFVLERDGLGPLTFEGRELAHVSTCGPYKDRWVELTIYKTTGNSYITQVVGQSRVQGEVSRCSVKVHDTAVQAVRSFVQKRTQELSRPAIDLLEDAAYEDEEIALVLDTIAEQPQRID
jgi:hypothetical protein